VLQLLQVGNIRRCYSCYRWGTVAGATAVTGGKLSQVGNCRSCYSCYRWGTVAAATAVIGGELSQLLQLLHGAFATIDELMYIATDSAAERDGQPRHLPKLAQLLPLGQLL
jgi:hypothetical protein